MQTNKIFLTAVIILLSIVNSHAQQVNAREKVVTNKWSLLAGTGNHTNHFLTNQEYQGGTTFGAEVEFGSFYKKSENVSWDFSLLALASPYSKVSPEMAPSNPAGTSRMSIYHAIAEYGSYYNWNPAKGLYIKAGGTFEFLFGPNSTHPNSINNSMTFDVQAQFKAAAGIKYGINFSKVGLYVFGDVTVPFLGMMRVDSQYQDSLKDNNILPGNINHFVLSSFHNMQGFNSEIGVEVVFRKITVSIASERNNRWWNEYDVQNYRKYDLFKLGFSVDLVSRSRLNSTNRYF